MTQSGFTFLGETIEGLGVDDDFCKPGDAFVVVPDGFAGDS